VALYVSWIFLRPGLYVDPSRLAEEATVRDWQLIGPFRLSAEAAKAQNPDYEVAGLDTDYLSALGVPESAVDAANWKTLSQRSGKWRSVRQSGAFLILDDLYPKVDFAVVYAASEIHSASDGDVALSVGSDDGVKVWCNGRLAIATPATTTRGALKYQNSAIVHLRKGSNFVLAKVDQKRNTWALVMNVSRMEYARKQSAEGHRQRLIIDRFPEPGRPLTLDLPFLEPGRSFRFAIQDRFGKEVESRDIHAGIDTEIALPANLGDGYFTCTLQVDARLLRDEFFLGDPERAIEALKAARNASPSRSRAQMAMDALLERYSQLNKPGRREARGVNWQKKVLLVLRDAVPAIAHPDSAEWLKSPGVHLRPYVSSIDGQTQHYVLSVPRNAGARIPLVLVMAPEVAFPRPLLESGLLWDAGQLDLYAGAAEDQGMALALIVNRGNTNNAPIGEADVFEVLDDIRRDLALDDRRLYVYGVCEGGRRALSLASHHPGMFAAVGADASPADGYGDSPDPSLRNWWARASVEKSAANLGGMPIILVRGDEDKVIPLSETMQVYNTLRGAGCNVELQILHGTGHKYFSVLPEPIVFPFLARQRSSTPQTVHLRSDALKNASAHWIAVRSAVDTAKPVEVESRRERGAVVVTTQNVSEFEIRTEPLGLPANGQLDVEWNGKRLTIAYRGGVAVLPAGGGEASGFKSDKLEGPVFDALAHPFLAVIGTGGTPDARDSAVEAANAFDTGWQKDFFVSCRTKRDTAVSSEDVRAYNLVLFGQPAADCALAKATASIPVTANDNGVSISTRNYTGSQLTYAAVFPNPLQANRYLVVIGSNSERWTLPEAHLALKGAFDYSVWDANRRQLASGTFGRNWR
jgi:dienelactone hydrolase